MAFNVVLLSSAAAFSAMRVYGMFEYRKLLFAFTCAWVLSTLLSLFIFMSRPSQTMNRRLLTLVACGVRLTPGHIMRKDDGRTRIVYAVGCAHFASDMAESRAHSSWEDHARSGSEDISEVLLKDNVVYFGILLIINLVGLAVGHQFELVYSVTTWIAILTAILIPRFMLDLREVGTPAGPATMADTELVTVRTMMFVERATFWTAYLPMSRMWNRSFSRKCTRKMFVVLLNSNPDDKGSF
ncbi:hypothetical protein B0H21DRAFT_527497 [Amylocystis lapponica]|nr:hypothetical protein B0H21DRAFT_527497 [Amylocystis lapponica]